MCFPNVVTARCGKSSSGVTDHRILCACRKQDKVFRINSFIFLSHYRNDEIIDKMDLLMSK